MTVLIDTILGAGGGDVASCADAVAATLARAAHEIRVEIVALRHGMGTRPMCLGLRLY